MKKIRDRLSKIIDWESGLLTDEETIEFFQELIDDSTAWCLQGCYGRTASYLIEAGFCHKREFDD